MIRSFKLAALGLSSVILSGAAFADDEFRATFQVDAALSTEANYVAFERIAAKACAADLRIVGGVAERGRIEADCETRLMSDAIAATGKQDLIALHQVRTGAQSNIRVATTP